MMTYSIVSGSYFDSGIDYTGLDPGSALFLCLGNSQNQDSTISLAVLVSIVHLWFHTYSNFSSIVFIKHYRIDNNALYLSLYCQFSRIFFKSLNLFLIVTSVTPDAAAISF